MAEAGDEGRDFGFPEDGSCGRALAEGWGQVHIPQATMCRTGCWVKHGLGTPVAVGHPGKGVCIHCQGSDHHKWVIREDFLEEA